MAVTAAQEITSRDTSTKGTFPANATARLYRGTLAFVDAATGGATDVINGGANKCAGIMWNDVDNSGGALGDLHAETYDRGKFLLYSATGGLTQADVGKKAYAIDNYDVGIVSTSNTYIGTIAEFVDANHVYVDLDPQLP